MINRARHAKVSAAAVFGVVFVGCTPASIESAGEDASSGEDGSLLPRADAAPWDSQSPVEEADADGSRPPVRDDGTMPDDGGGLGHIACDGGVAPYEVLATGLANPYALAVDSTSVYWTDPGCDEGTVGGCHQSGDVMKCAVGGCGGLPTTVDSVAGGPHPFVFFGALAVNSSSVYFSASTLQSCPTDGCDGSPTTRFAYATAADAGDQSQFAANGIAVDSTSFYWTSTSTDGLGSPGGAVMKCALGGCVHPTILAAALNEPWGIAVDSTNVYWASNAISGSGSLAGVVMKCAIGGCAEPTTVALEPEEVRTVAVDSTSVYWATSGAIKKCALDGCAQPTTLVSGLALPQAIAVDSTSVYWGSDGGLMKCALDGCAQPTVLASGSFRGGPQGIALDSRSVYWTPYDPLDGSVGYSLEKVPKDACVTLPPAPDASTDDAAPTDGGPPEGEAAALPLTGVTAVSAGEGWHACAMLSSGTAECWGNNDGGQLGNGTTNFSASAVAVSNLTGVTAVAPGVEHTCALLSGGAVSCWGNNSDGELGNGTTTSSSTPVAVPNLTGVTAIAAGSLQTCALLSNGTVECWGNWSESLDGTLNSWTTSLTSTTPVAIPNLTAVTAISAGDEYACALVVAGAVECWGNNEAGQLGSGPMTFSSTPVSVPTLTGAVAISAGREHACALLSDGTVGCWGGNDEGQLGDGTTTPSSTPVAVTTLIGTKLAGAVAVAAGAFHTCALLSGGTVVCWGANEVGELGNAMNFASYSPVLTYGVTGATAIAAGAAYSCARLSGGTAECWGGNNGLGDFDTTTAYSPIPVVVPM
jgi:alpha-tubulin suppressor-like RCC1 family protein